MVEAHARELDDEDLREAWSELDAAARRALLHLGRLYLEMQVAPSAATHREIARIERAIADGEVPYVPATQ